MSRGFHGGVDAICFPCAMGAINSAMMPHWNLSPSAPPGLVSMARLASGTLPMVAFGGVLVMLPFKGAWRRAGFGMLLAMAIAWLAARGIHAHWPQPRPFMLGIGTHWVEHAGSAAFPSRHATIGLAMGIAGLLFTPHRLAGAACLVVGALIAWSRVALGVHFPMDVLGGGVVAAVSVAAVYPFWRRRCCRDLLAPGRAANADRRRMA